MPERRFDRRQFGRLTLGFSAVLGVSGLTDSGSADTFVSEDRYNRFINEKAFRAADNYGSAKLPTSLAFDISSESYAHAVLGEERQSYTLDSIAGSRTGYVPLVIKEGLPPPPETPRRPSWEQEVLLAPVFKGPSDRPLVALTIDDGYFGRDEILSTILDKKVSATFFIIGSVLESNPEFVIRAQNSGKITWGNHTYSHGNLTAKTTSAIQNELQGTEKVLAEIAGTTTIPFMRPPGGARNGASTLAAANLGYRTFIWNVSGDAGTQWRADDPWPLVNYYTGLLDRQANPWGSIILLHFRTVTSVALPILIDEVRRRGMEPVSLDKLYEGGRV